MAGMAGALAGYGRRVHEQNLLDLQGKISRHDAMTSALERYSQDDSLDPQFRNQALQLSLQYRQHDPSKKLPKELETSFTDFMTAFSTNQSQQQQAAQQRKLQEDTEFIKSLEPVPIPQATMGPPTTLEEKIPPSFGGGTRMGVQPVEPQPPAQFPEGFGQPIPEMPGAGGPVLSPEQLTQQQIGQAEQLAAAQREFEAADIDMLIEKAIGILGPDADPTDIANWIRKQYIQKTQLAAPKQTVLKPGDSLAVGGEVVLTVPGKPGQTGKTIKASPDDTILDESGKVIWQGPQAKTGKTKKPTAAELTRADKRQTADRVKELMASGGDLTSIYNNAKMGGENPSVLKELLALLQAENRTLAKFPPQAVSDAKFLIERHGDAQTVFDQATAGTLKVPPNVIDVLKAMGARDQKGGLVRFVTVE